MKLQGRFGDIDTGIDDCVVGLHSFDRVLTHPYLYELTVLAAAPATVRVWSTGRARRLLGGGGAPRRPRSPAAARAPRGLHEPAPAADCPWRKGSGLIFLPVQEKQEIERNAVTK